MKYFLAGLAVAAGGMLFSDIAGAFFNGMDYGSAVDLGIGPYGGGYLHGNHRFPSG